MQKKRGCASASEATCFINHPERNLELSSYSTFFNSLKKMGQKYCWAEAANEVKYFSRKKNTTN